MKDNDGCLDQREDRFQDFEFCDLRKLEWVGRRRGRNMDVGSPNLEILTTPSLPPATGGGEDNEEGISEEETRAVRGWRRCRTPRRCGETRRGAEGKGYD